MPKAEAGARLHRLLAILPWLAERKRAPIAEVAARFAMTEAEVVSELELAACCGLPPYTPDQLIELVVTDTEVEANLGQRLVRPQRFTAAEGFTLAASARAILAVPGADPGGALARAVAKLETVLGDRRRVAVDLDAPPLLATVRAAITDRERLEVRYYSASRDELTTRRIDPYVAFSHDGRWYLDAYCHLVGDIRHFRVGRIQSATRTGEHFDPPLVSTPEEVFSPGPDTTDIVLSVPPSGRWVAETYPTRLVEERRDGTLRIGLSVGGRAWLERLLLRLGPAAEVLEPADLAGAGREAAMRLLARYG